MRGEYTLDKRHDIGAMEDVQLGGVLFEDLCECKFLDGTSSIAGGVQRDMRGRGRESIDRGTLDCDETLGT